MISTSQKFSSVLWVLAFNGVGLATSSAGDSKLLDWVAPADPTGLLIDQGLVEKPEIRGDAEADEKTKILKFKGGSMVTGVRDEKKFRHLLQKNNELTIAVTVIPHSDEQGGPARIVSYSTDHSDRNFTIGQQGKQFDLRLRTEGGNDNGELPHSSFGSIEAGKKYHIAVSYKPGLLQIAVDGKVVMQRDDIKGGLKNWSPQQFVLGDEFNGDRAWRGEIHALSIHNRAFDLRKRPPGKAEEQQWQKELAQLRRAVAELRAKLEQDHAERQKLILRIGAADKAGAELERRLAECHDTSALLKDKLAAASALARREHQRAETVSAEVLEQVEAQKAVANELKQTIAQVKIEREALLAKLEAKPEFDADAHKRLIEENEQLMKNLKAAWANRKENELLEAELDKAKKSLAEQKRSLEEKQKLLVKQAEMVKELTTFKYQLDQQGKKLKAEHEMRHKLEKRVQDLTVRRVQAELLAEERRTELVREQIARKKLESKLKASQEAALKAAAEARLLDIDPIYFNVNQAESEAQEKRLLKQIKAIHATFPEARFIVTGHTCTDGSAAANLALSQRRAERVAEILKKNGIPGDRIGEVIGKGETQPQADNATLKGREANRRVEVKVLR